MACGLGNYHIACKICSSNPPAITWICGPSNSRARHHRSIKRGSKLNCFRFLLLCSTSFDWRFYDRLVSVTDCVLAFTKKCEKIDASPIKWSIALKQFVGKSQLIFWVCLAILRSWHLKGLTKKTLHWRWHDLVTDNIYFSRGLTILLENWKKACVPDDINYGGFIDLARFSNTDPREY